MYKSRKIPRKIPFTCRINLLRAIKQSTRGEKIHRKFEETSIRAMHTSRNISITRRKMIEKSRKIHLESSKNFLWTFHEISDRCRMSMERGLYGDIAMDLAADEGRMKNQLVSKWDRKKKRFVKVWYHMTSSFHRKFRWKVGENSAKIQVGLSVDVNNRRKNEAGVKIKKEDQGKMWVFPKFKSFILAGKFVLWFRTSSE